MEENVQNNEKSTEYKLGGVTGKGFMPGQSGNPGGRPKGGLKDYDRQRFLAMSDEEKEEFLSKIPPEIRYRMAEGNPHQTQDTRVEGALVVEISKEIAEKNNVPSSNPEDGSQG